LRESISELRSQAVSGNFTREENLHLTLAFIGETNRISALKEVIDSTAPESLSLLIGGVGRFRRQSGDIYWVGIEKDPKLMEYADNLSVSLRRAGFNIENREYKPHITIGREVVAESKIELAVPITAMTVNRISLMKSERIQGTLTYTEIYGKEI
jgi:2'-5' RNA ligase